MVTMYLIVSDHEDILVGHKHLERVHTFKQRGQRGSRHNVLNLYVPIQPSHCVLAVHVRLGRQSTSLSDEGAHILADLVAPPGDRHVEGVVAAHFGVCPATPLVVHLQQRLVLATQHKVNYREGTQQTSTHAQAVGERGGTH